MANNDALRFESHDLNIQCYSAGDVRLVYAGSLHELCKGDIAPAKQAADDTKYPGFKSGSYNAFASPVQIDWKSLDGSKHSHTVDLDSIFKNRKVLHADDPKQIYQPMPISGGEPTIIVEVNDRTLNVYMFVTIQLLPANPNAVRRDKHDHRTLAYSKQF